MLGPLSVLDVHSEHDPDQQCMGRHSLSGAAEYETLNPHRFEILQHSTLQAAEA